MINSVLKDLYPRPGDRIKLWVIQTRKFEKWQSETCPRFKAGPHHRDDDAICEFYAETIRWCDLQNNECSICNQIAEQHRNDPVVVKWLEESERRRKLITKDRSLLSNEIAKDLTLRAHPLLKLL